MTTRRFFKHPGTQAAFSAWYAELRPKGIAKTIDHEDRTEVVLRDGRKFTHYHDAGEHDDAPAPTAKGSHNPERLAKALEILVAEQAAAMAQLEQLRKESDDMSATKGKADAAAFGKTMCDIGGRDQGSRLDAMRKARRQSPEAFAAYQAGSTPARNEDVAKVRAAGKAASAEIDKRVSEIRAAHNAQELRPCAGFARKLRTPS
jgi:hypothetical protein